MSIPIAKPTQNEVAHAAEVAGSLDTGQSRAKLRSQAPAPLPAAYSDTPMFWPTVPEPEEMVMTLPHPRSHMPSIVALTQFSTP